MSHLEIAVEQALAWLKKHPHRDYIDAAFYVAASTERTDEGSRFSTNQWPVLVATLRAKTMSQSPGVMS